MSSSGVPDEEPAPYPDTGIWGEVGLGHAKGRRHLHPFCSLRKAMVIPANAGIQSPAAVINDVTGG